MSMKREEIIKEYENAVVASGLAAAAGNEDAAKSYELFKAGLSALRPVSREHVEKVWRGEWKENKNAAIESAICSKCKTVFQAYYGNYQFCPRCGAPMTDEAVQMVMRRLEALKDGSTTD